MPIVGAAFVATACASHVSDLQSDGGSVEGTFDSGALDGGADPEKGDSGTIEDSGGAFEDAGAGDSGGADSGRADSGDVEDAALDADVDASVEKVVLPREPLPRRGTLLRLVNDTADSVQLLEGCNGEDWLAGEVVRGNVPSDACACSNKLVDGTCLVPEPTLTCQAFWYVELPAGESHERQIQARRLTWFDAIGCYIWEGLPEGTPLEYRLSLEAAGEITRTVPYGTELIEVKVSEAE